MYWHRRSTSAESSRRTRYTPTDDLHRLLNDGTVSAGARDTQGVPFITPTPQVGAWQCEPVLRGPPRTRKGRSRAPAVHRRWPIWRACPSPDDKGGVQSGQDRSQRAQRCGGLGEGR